LETQITTIGVVMQRRPLDNRWQPHQWRPIEIVDHAVLAQGSARCLRDDIADTRWLFAGFDINLFTDECEGYFLNISSPLPCWFVMWRMEERDGSDVAVPKSVTLSYNEAARLMDGGEQVDTIAASTDIVACLADFVARHYKPEPKGKRRKPSFEGGQGVEQMAKAEGDRHGR
jgi:hypothetical protein